VTDRQTDRRNCHSIYAL